MSVKMFVVFGTQFLQAEATLYCKLDFYGF